MFSYTATIGRNFSPTHPLPGLQSKPMTLSAWERFAEDVQADMVKYLQAGQVEPVTVEVHYGRGEWNGVTEESAKITVLRNDYADADYLTDLRYSLEILASDYGQDAIAFTVGTSELL